MTIEQKLSEIKERCEKAAAGPWIVRKGLQWSTVYQQLPDGATTGLPTKSPNSHVVSTHENVEFIAAARIDVPKLIEALEMALETMQDVRSECTSINSSPDWCINHICECIEKIQAILDDRNGY